MYHYDSIPLVTETSLENSFCTYSVFFVHHPFPIYCKEWAINLVRFADYLNSHKTVSMSTDFTTVIFWSRPYNCRRDRPNSHTPKYIRWVSHNAHVFYKVCSVVCRTGALWDLWGSSITCQHKNVMEQYILHYILQGTWRQTFKVSHS